MMTSFPARAGAPLPRRIPQRSAQLLGGLVLYGLGIALISRGQIGAAPWDVLSQGLAQQTSLSFGTITILTSVVVLLAWIPIRQRPGAGTVLNALLVGPSADLGLALIPADLPLWLRLLCFASGVVLLASATGIYIGARFGPGPRDGLMTGLHRVTGRPIWIVRTAIEAAVVTAGWLLGGNVGPGTLLFVLTIGPLCQITIPLFASRRGARPAPDGVPAPKATQRG
ncbi:membrane protein YczE [Leucobacter sp. M11]|uniref:membrane protein YczE n=1 Tax=Leucobacter sp. M11 TaxID=2993565 RepID=UPI002D7F5922|nr:hypothetical protein [Leucobacter sp. M11]